MPDFIIKENIAHFERLLAKEADVEKILVLQRLLAEEKAKLAEWLANNPRSKAAE